MNDYSFAIAQVFYFVWPCLLAYWLANRIVRELGLVEQFRASRQQAQARANVLDLQAMPLPEGRQEGRISRQ